MKKDFTQPFIDETYVGAHLLVEVEGKFLQFIHDDHGAFYANCLFTDLDMSKDWSVQLVKVLYEHGLSLERYRELARNVTLEYSFVNETTGVNHEVRCLHLLADRTEREIPKDGDEAPIFASLDELDANFWQAVNYPPIVQQGIQMLRNERRK